MKKITKETYINWYKDMLFWRKFEDKLAALYIQQKIRGFLHLYNGQEAVLAGALHAMILGKDKMITAYRNHVQPIGMGVDPKRIMAELYGKEINWRVTGSELSKYHIKQYSMIEELVPEGSKIMFCSYVSARAFYFKSKGAYSISHFPVLILNPFRNFDKVQDIH